MIKTTLTVATASALLTASVLAETPPIERLAPENTILIAGSRNFSSLMERFKDTSLWMLWESDQIKKMRDEFVKQMGEGLDKAFQELGVEKDSLIPPSGQVGFALFTVRDPELDTPQISFLLTADYGNEENVKKTDSIVQAALAKGEKEGDIEIEHKDVNGRTVHTIDLSSKMANAQDADGDEDMDEMDMEMGGMPSPADLLKGVEKLHYVLDGNSVLICSDLQTLTDALDSSDGKPAAGKRMTDRPEYQAITGKLGDHDFFGVLLTRDIMEILSAADPMGMMQMMKPTIQAMFGEVHGYGMAGRFDGPTAMVEQTLYAYMPKGKQGITALMDMPAQRGTLPPFVGADAISYNHFKFRFSGLMDVIKTVVGSNPFLAMQLGAQLDQVAPVVNQYTSTLGTQVHWITSASRPFTGENRQTLIAIECVKPQEFENLISGFAAQAGIEARDFLGQRIYTLPEEMGAMMMPMPGMQLGSMSLGIGGGYVLMGATAGVEQGLRATSGAAEAGASSLATASEFQRATGALSRDGVIAWGYADTVDNLESTLAVQRHNIEQMNEAAEEWAAEEGGAEIAEAQKTAQENLRQSMKIWDQIDFDLLRKHIGPGAWQMQSTEDGLVIRFYTLSASSATTSEPVRGGR